MSTTPDTAQPARQAFTDAQIQAAIDAAFAKVTPAVLSTVRGGENFDDERPHRLAIARAFLAELGKIKPADADDPYTRLKAYAAAGARIRCRHKRDKTLKEWTTGVEWKWVCHPDLYEVHPDDLHLRPEYAPKHPDAQENWNQYEDKTLGQIAFEAFGNAHKWQASSQKDKWQKAAKAVVNASKSSWSESSAELIKKAEAAGVDPNEVPWIPHDGGSCPLKDEEVEEWEVKYSDGDKGIYTFEVSLGAGWRATTNPYVAYRVLRWKPGHGPAEPPQAKPATFEAHGKTWNSHKPGDPMPCDPESKIDTLLEDGDIGGTDTKAKRSDWGIRETGDNIIGWRYTDEQPEPKLPIATLAKDQVDATPEVQVAVEAVLQEEVFGQPWQPSPGDVVRLKSGGPEMTVSSLRKNGDAECRWFDQHGHNCVAFPTACLQPVTK